MKKEQYDMMNRLEQIGISWSIGQQLRRISMTLNRWFERECGTDNGCIERDETTGKTFWLNADTGRRFPIPDRETGARKRLDRIMAGFSDLVPYVQGDCRGAALYILRKSDLKPGDKIDSVYTRGIAVY